MKLNPWADEDEDKDDESLVVMHLCIIKLLMKKIEQGLKCQIAI